MPPSATPPPEVWPLSAAATYLLRDPAAAQGGEVLKLALRELVLRRVWRLERRERAGVMRFRSGLAIARGAQRAPAETPLPQLDAALNAAVGSETLALKRVVKRLVGHESSTGRKLLEVTLGDLERRGLVRVERTRVLRLIPRSRPVLTPDGELTSRESRARETALREALTDPLRAAAAAAAAGALLLFVEPDALSELEEDRRDGSGGARDWAYRDASDPGIDSAVDAGGGGGDGDGGGDGGGGGD